MSLRYSCFISYRSCNDELGKRIVTELRDGLSGELALMTDKEVYLDNDRLTGGYLFNEAIAKALCESVCLVMVFVNKYFDLEHCYCAREYKGMEELETQRLSLLQNHNDRIKGLIIPIVFRGWEYLPEEIKAIRQCYRFDDFILSCKAMHRHQKFAPKIREVAEYIAERCVRLDDLASNSLTNCENYNLPTETQIREWLEMVSYTTPPFPGR